VVARESFSETTSMPDMKRGDLVPLSE